MIQKIYNYGKGIVTFKGTCVKQNSVSSIHRNAANLYISYELDTWSRELNTDFTLGSCFFGAVKLAKNTDPDKCGYSGYGNEFEACSQFLLSDGSWGNRCWYELSVHVDNKNNNILVLVEGTTQGLDDTNITAEAKYSINFRQSRKRFVLSLHYNGSNTFLFVNEVKIYQL